MSAIYLSNKYTKWYNLIINNRIQHPIKTYKPGKTEVHHIIPRSLGGSNIPENLVRLYNKEHLIVHLLLPKMTTGQDKAKMVHAAWCMTTRKGFKINSKLYDALRIEHSKQASTSMKQYQASQPWTSEKRAAMSLKL